MRALWLVLTLLAAAHASAYDRFVSPNGEFQAYTTANFRDGSGMRLFLRGANARDTGVLLAQNGRWIDLTKRWNERPPASRPSFISLKPFHFERHALPVAVAQLRLVRPNIALTKSPYSSSLVSSVRRLLRPPEMKRVGENDVAEDSPGMEVREINGGVHLEVRA